MAKNPTRLAARLPIAIHASAEGKDRQGDRFVEPATLLNISDVGALMLVRDLHGAQVVSLRFSVPPDLPTPLKCVQSVRAQVIRAVFKDDYIMAGVQFRQPLSALIRDS